MKKEKKVKVTKEQKMQKKEEKKMLKKQKKQEKQEKKAALAEKKELNKKKSHKEKKKKNKPEKQLTEKQQKKREERAKKVAARKEKKNQKRIQKGKVEKNAKPSGKRKSRKAKRSIRFEIVFITILPLVILTGTLAVYCQQALRSTLENEALTGLKDLCYSLEGTFNILDSGDYELDEGASATYMRKGDYQITKDQSLLEDLKQLSEVDFSVYYGSQVKATSITSHKTGSKIIDDEAPEEVVEQVINQKQEYGTSEAVINEDDYYAYYLPLKNAGGKVIGMLFAGKPCATINKEIQQKIVGVLVVAFIILILAVVIVVLIASKIGLAVRKAEGVLGQLSEGDLNIQVDARLARRKDELGVMAKALDNLMEKLRDVLRNIKQSSQVLSNASGELNQFSASTEKTADEVGRAVNEISQGAHTQSEDIEDATAHIDQMGETIQKIVAKVENLNHTSDAMENSKAEAEEIIQELVDSSEKTYSEVQKIENQVRVTDDAVKKIGAAITLISSIADETNLLSLNASIEAARAGEAGKGFSVVAAQIQKLAEESNQSAAGISKIIEELARESEKTVIAMDEMNQILDEQQEKLQITQYKFGDVSRGIQASRGEVLEIRKDSEDCDEVRVKVNDVIRNLAATSEQNAAATQETTASMEELYHTMSVLTEKSDELGALAQKMENDLEYFKL
ncbi:MAG: methyl-accepting chemotaxis protein [Eubacterium sp.]|nr:methyl-accepting chemotaxis protein [Eubacterium sp.]